MTITTEFPDFDNGAEFAAMGILLGAEFKDDSYGNDTCPKYYGAADETGDSGIMVFVDYKDPNSRELPDTEDLENRFYVLAQLDGVDVRDNVFSDITRAAQFARDILAQMKAESE